MDITREQLDRLHVKATEARDSANRAYDIALKNHANHQGDSRDAFQTVIKTNQLMNDLYELILRSIASSE